MTTYEWTKIFKALANDYRLQIIRLLKKHHKLSVTEITKELGITMKNTSRNLGILQNASILKSLGKSDHVYYEISFDVNKKVKHVVDTLLK